MVRNVLAHGNPVRSFPGAQGAGMQPESEGLATWGETSVASFESGNRAQDEDSFLDWEGRATLFEDEEASEDEDLDEEDDAPRPRAGKGRGARSGARDLEARDDDEEEDEDEEDDEDEDEEDDDPVDDADL